MTVIPSEEQELRKAVRKYVNSEQLRRLNDFEEWETLDNFPDEFMAEDELLELIEAYANAKMSAVLDQIEWAYKHPLEGTGYLSIDHVIQAQRNKLTKKEDSDE